jgi:hypothetical protein
MMRYVIAWVPLLVVAVVNGVLREATYANVLPELRAHQLSTLTGAVLVGLVVRFIIQAWPPASGRQALLVGVLWMALTVAFEFFMGLVLAGRPLSQVLHDYNLAAGRVWVLFLVWLTVAPWLLRQMQPPR